MQVVSYSVLGIEMESDTRAGDIWRIFKMDVVHKA
jgi:hypothetical protein